MYTLEGSSACRGSARSLLALVSLAAFGIGNMVQANSVADSLRSSFGIAPSLTGVVLAAITAVVILGGIKRIGEVAEILVPAMAIFYLAGGLLVLVRYAQRDSRGDRARLRGRLHGHGGNRWLRGLDHDAGAAVTG